VLSKWTLLFITCTLSLLLSHGIALAAELKVFASRAIWTVLAEVGPEFEKNSAHKLNVIMGLSSEFVGRINGGEAFDVIAAPPAALDGLIASGKVAADSKTNLARSGYGVVIRAGSSKPDISSVEAFKRALLNAKSITYLPVPGVPQLIERLGLKEAIASKTTMPNSDISSELVATGEIELGVVAITQVFTTPRIELVGPLPPEFRCTPTSAARSARLRKPLMPHAICSNSLKGQQQFALLRTKEWRRSDVTDRAPTSVLPIARRHRPTDTDPPMSGAATTGRWLRSR
jgi:molybdate transport system substrate-binding protein